MLVVWDFDGVLNRGFQGGFFLWQQGFEADLGTSAQVFTDYMFNSTSFADVLVGKTDLLDLLADYTSDCAVPHSPRALLDYWLNRDAHPDEQVADWLKRCPHPGVIATNNEAHRADFIWRQMGFATRMQHIFASGPMGVRKPDPQFFTRIMDWSGLPAAEHLLIDDAEKNITAAADLGWQVFHFTDATRDALPGVLGITP